MSRCIHPARPGQDAPSAGPRQAPRTRLSGVAAVCMGLASLGQAQTHEAGKPAAPVLPEVTVTDSAAAKAPDASRDVLQKQSSTGSRIPLAIRETPLSVTVIPQRVLEEQDARTLADALKNLASLAQEGNNGGRQASFRSRGFLIDDETGTIVDGQPMFGLLDIPIELMDRVEVLRGPASVQYGRGAGQIGGIVNLIRKRPTDERFVSLKASGGSWNYKRLHLDASGRVPDQPRLGYRINVSRERSDSFRDSVYLNKDVFGIVLDARLTDTLSATFLADVVDRDTPWDIGQFFYRGAVNDVPRSVFFELPWGAQSTLNKTAGYELEWKLPSQWTLKHQYTWQGYHINRHQSGKTAPNVTSGAFNVTESRSTSDVSNHSLVLDLIGDHRLLGMRHRSVIGYHRLGKVQSTFASLVNNTYPSNIFNPAVFVQRPLAMSTIPSKVDATYQGFYAEDFIGLLPTLDLMVGVRHDRFDETSATAAVTPVVDNRVNSATTPRVGVVYTPTPPVSVYLSLGKGFLPGARAPAGNVNAGELMDPQRSRQLELGAKTLWLNDRLALNLAVFDFTRYNIPYTETDPVTAARRTVLIGEQRNKGYELELIGDLAHNWQVMASHAHVKGRIVKANANEGLEQAHAPGQSTKLWTSYTFGTGPLAGLTVNGGVYSQGKVFADGANAISLGGYVRLDAGVSWRLRAGPSQLTLRLNAENLTDRKYYFGNNAQAIFPGAPRNARLSVEARF